MKFALISLMTLFLSVASFAPTGRWANVRPASTSYRSRSGHFMSDETKPSPEVTSSTEGESDPMEDEFANMSAEEREMREKQIRADELRAQEVFMQKSTGIHKCTNCDWQYDPEKGDKNMIGGMVEPGTAFAELPSNWRCPVCRASKDSFVEVVEEIPGFEVNQGYGFGTNSWTAGQKNLAIFGGLGFFFLLFLSGYAMS